MDWIVNNNKVKIVFKNQNIFRLLIGSLVIATVLVGCSGALPKSETVRVSPWNSFEEAKAAYDKIELYQTRKSHLISLGFDPYTTPNTKILTYLDIIDHFLPNESIRMEHLDEGVRACLESRELCNGYEIVPENLESHREGNVLADMFNFKRHTIKTGWNFRAIIIMKEELVVYKLWGGTPRVHIVNDQRQPLGPLQDSGDLLKDNIIP